MPDEPNLANGGLGGDSPAEGQAASAMGNSVVNSRLSVDLRMLEGLNKELNTLNENTKKIKSNFKDLIRDTKELTSQLNKAATAMGKVSGKSGSGYMDMSKGMPPAASGPSQSALDADMILKRLMGGGAASGGGLDDSGGIQLPGKAGKIQGGLKTFGKLLKDNPYFAAGQTFANVVGAGADIIDSRVDRNRSYALPADNLSVQLQQQYGMSQMGVMNQLRGPLRQYRLGAGGINDLLAMQSRTGINAQQQASSVEGMRTLMGYGYSTGDITNYIESMGQADTVNRMFMMTGTSLYGIGGKQKSAQQVNQELIQRLGLNNREVIQAGRQSGSVIRQRLQMSGLDQGAQDMLLQYAESNVSFREKGGEGFYDPSKKADRERMGIEGNYATQVEETERVKVDREEQMYKRQADNYADMEKNIQRVNKVLGEFEDQLSTIVGARTSTRQLFGGHGMKLLGGATMLAGGALAATGIGSTLGIGMMAAGAGMFTKGDATTGGAASPGRIASENPTKKPQNTAVLAQLKPVLREPLAKLMEDRPGISIGQGYRSPEAQKKMFLERYYRTDKETNTYWDGSYWEKKPGVAMAAPPGLSYHEIGLAADLLFASDADRQYLQANAAKYGLDEFSRHGEPWHVQPKAVPASRRHYEEEGATYGTTEDPETKYTPQTVGVITETGPEGQTGVSMDPGAAVKQQLSIAESMSAFSEQSVGGANPSTYYKKKKGGKDNEDRGAPVKTKVDLHAGAINPQELARILMRKKFQQQDIWKMLAIAWRESRLNPRAYVKDHDDDSYGLFQINMLKYGEKRAKDFGITNYNELFDPKTNAKAARILYGDGKGMMHWNKNGNPLGSIESGTINWAKEVAASVGLPTTGDPFDKGYVPQPRRSSPQTPSKISDNSTTNNNTFTINPTINVTSSGSTQVDAARLAKEVSKLIEKEVRMLNVRSS